MERKTRSGHADLGRALLVRRDGQSALSGILQSHALKGRAKKILPHGVMIAGYLVMGNHCYPGLPGLLALSALRHAKGLVGVIDRTPLMHDHFQSVARSPALDILIERFYFISTAFLTEQIFTRIYHSHRTSLRLHPL